MVNTMYIQLKALHTLRRRRQNTRPIRLIILLLLSFTLTVVSLGFGSAQIDPVLTELAEPAAINMINDTVNAAFKKFVAGADISYDDLVHITKNEQGQITSITTNSELLNLMCIQVNDDVSAQLSRKNVKVKIPLGSLTRADVLSGKGPSFSISLSQSNTVDAYTESTFKDAGVNQTEHVITFTVEAAMTVILPNTTVTYTYSQPFIVTQSIIVGNVPTYYTQSK